MRTLMLLLVISRTLARSVGRSSFISCKSPGQLSQSWNSARRFSQQAQVQFPEEVRTAIADLFDDVRNDRIELPDVGDQTLKKNLNLRSFTNLTKYARELDAVLRRATFVGCTTVARHHAMTNCLLHFRGYERAENVCMCFDPKHFPLFPTIPTPFKGITERSMDHFEHTLSGIGGLRVAGVHTPYPFRSVLAIDFADTETPDNVIYKLVTVSERTNKLLLVDNTDQMVMGTSECLEQHDLKDYQYVGKKLELPPVKKTLPTGDESLEEFKAHFRQLNDVSVAKALLTVFQGIDYEFVQALCAELEIESSSYFYRVPDVGRLHDVFVRKVRAALSNQGPYEEIARRVYHIYGGLSPSYRLNRMLEKTTNMADEFTRRLSKLQSQCERDGNEAVLASATSKIEEISHYRTAIEDVRATRDPKKLENLEVFQEQLLRIYDPDAYKKTKKRKKAEKQVEAKATKRVKKVGRILRVPVNDSEDAPLLIVGKNAKQNEVVTHDLRQKGDLWLHARSCPGGHVLLRNYRNDRFSVQIAADVASFFSKYSALRHVEVVVADVEKVRRGPHSQLGAVMVDEFRTVVGDPERGAKFIADYKARTGR